MAMALQVETLSRGSLPDPDLRDCGFSDDPSSLSVLLLYEDAPTALRAKQLVDQLAEHAHLVASFQLSLCRFDLLDVPALRELDTGESCTLDLLLLSAHGDSDLAPAVWAWLDRWLVCNPERPRALVVSLDGHTRNSASANQILYFLQAAADRVGVEVFSHFGETHASELDSAIANIRYRAETTSALLDESLHRSGSQTFRFWGIND